MNPLRLARRVIFLLCLTLPVCIIGGSVRQSAPPDERDRQVLEALLLHLLADPKLDLSQVPPQGATIVLHQRTPKKTGFLMSHQIRTELSERTLPAGAEEDLRRRNAVPAKIENYESVAATYTALKFAPGIVVADLEQTHQKAPYSSPWFEEAFPKARGFLEAYLPGYSEDGNWAVVRAGTGPWAHAAMLTAVLEKRDGKWTVAWYHIARFA